MDSFEPRLSKPVQILTLMAGLGIVWLATVIFYRLTLHSLAKYPGPLLGRITDLYSLYHALRGDIHIEFYRLHQKYGEWY